VLSKQTLTQPALAKTLGLDQLHCILPHVGNTVRRRHLLILTAQCITVLSTSPGVNSC
jgi:hypothetical protein